MITTDEFGTKTIYPLCSGDAVALTTGPADLDLGDLDRDLTPAETGRLEVLLWLTPFQAVMLAQQLFDTASASLSVEQIEHIRAQLTPSAETRTSEFPTPTNQENHMTQQSGQHLPAGAHRVAAVEASVGRGYIAETSEDVIYLNVVDPHRGPYTIVMLPGLGQAVAHALTEMCAKLNTLSTKNGDTDE